MSFNEVRVRFGTASTLAVLVACAAPRSKPATTDAPASKPSAASALAPRHKLHWGGLKVRAGADLVDASPDDAAVVQGYDAWEAKGSEVDSIRLTLMTAKTDYAIGESIHVVHVLEVTAPGRDVYIMGPKAAWGEYLDGALATTPPETKEYPWVGAYDGATLPSPEIDYNYDITHYQFDLPGTHVIQWQLGTLTSNPIVVRVR
jgi:hypothetical protein